MFFIKTPPSTLCSALFIILSAFLFVVVVDAQLCHVSFASEESEKSSIISSGSWGNITWDASFVVDMCAASSSTAATTINRVQISGLIINGQPVTPFDVQQNQIVPIPSTADSSSSLFRLLISSREIVTTTQGGSSQTAVVFRLVIFAPSGAVAADICPDIFVGFLKPCVSFSQIWPIVTGVGWSSLVGFAIVMAVGFMRRTALMQRYEKMESDAHWQGSLGTEVMRVRIVDPHAIAEKYTSSTKKLKPKTERDFPLGKRRADPSSGLRSFACVHTMVDDTISSSAQNNNEHEERVLHFEARLMYNRGRHMKPDEPEQYCLIQLLQVIDLPNEYYLVIRSGRVGASGFSTLVHCSGEVEGIADFFSQISTKRAEDWEVIDGPVHPANFVLERMFPEGKHSAQFVSPSTTTTTTTVAIGSDDIVEKNNNKNKNEDKILVAIPTNNQNQESQNIPVVEKNDDSKNNENLLSVSRQQKQQNLQPQERDEETKKLAQQQLLQQQQQQQHNDASRRIHQEQETLDRSRQEFDESQSRQILNQQHAKIISLVAAAVAQEEEENRKKKERHDQEEKIKQDRLLQQQQQLERERNISNTNNDRFLEDQRQQLAKERDELAKEKLRFDQERIAHQEREQETKKQKQREQQELEHQRQDMERKRKEMEEEKQRLLLSYTASSNSGSPPAVTPREAETDDVIITKQQNQQQPEKTKSSSSSSSSQNDEEEEEEKSAAEQTPNKNAQDVVKTTTNKSGGDDEDELENTFTFNLKGTKKPSTATTKQRRKETPSSSSTMASPNNNNNNTSMRQQQEARGDSLATFRSDYDEEDIRTAEPFLGFSVTVHSHEPELGPVVDAIWTNGPAHRAGIRLGDRVSHLWGRQVHTLADVKKIFAENVAVGDRMILHVHNDDINTNDGGSSSSSHSSNEKSATTTSLGAGTKEGHSGDEDEEEEDEEARRYTMFMLPILTADRRFVNNRLFFDISNSQQIFQKK